MFANITVFINKKLCKNMRQFKVLLLLIAISCSMFAQDRLSLFIGRANKYAYWMIIIGNVEEIGGM